MSEDQNNIVTLKVRVTSDFREKITTTAKENNRSMNAEIVSRLEDSFIAEEQEGLRMQTEVLAFFSGILAGYQTQLIKLKTELKKLDQSNEEFDANKRSHIEYEIFKISIACEEFETLKEIIANTPPSQSQGSFSKFKKAP